MSETTEPTGAEYEKIIEELAVFARGINTFKLVAQRAIDYLTECRREAGDG